MIGPLPPTCALLVRESTPSHLGLIQLPGFSHHVLTGVQKRVCSPRPERCVGNTAAQKNLRERGREDREVWLCSIIQYQKIIKMGW